eukprot:3519990-Amphidinium_carterae.1
MNFIPAAQVRFACVDCANVFIASRCAELETGSWIFRSHGQLYSQTDEPAMAYVLSDGARQRCVQGACSSILEKPLEGSGAVAVAALATADLQWAQWFLKGSAKLGAAVALSVLAGGLASVRPA